MKGDVMFEKEAREQICPYYDEINWPSEAYGDEYCIGKSCRYWRGKNYDEGQCVYVKGSHDHAG